MNLARSSLFASSILGFAFVCAPFLSALTPVILRPGIEKYPPPDVWASDHQGHVVLKFNNGVRGTVTADTTNRAIHIFWVDTTTGVQHFQSFTTAFWVTTLGVSSDNSQLLVAGKRGSGTTVIRRWTFSAPTSWTGIPPRGGPFTSRLSDSRVLSDHPVYEGATVGLDNIQLMAGVRGVPDSLLVQFWDSKDVYVLSGVSTENRILTLLASPLVSQLPGVMYIPELDANFRRMTARRHVAHGYVYAFLSAPLGVDSLILTDGNLDGRIDDFIPLSGDDWFKEGLGDRANYVH